VIAIAALLLASQSVAYPIGLAGLPTVAIALLGSNPLPRGGVSLLVFGWMATAIVVELARNPRALPARVLAASPLGLSLALGVWMLTRLGASGNEPYGREKIEIFLLANLTMMTAAILVARRRRNFDLFVALFLLVAAGGAMLLLFKILTGSAQTVFYGRYALENPIGFARTSADGILFVVFVLVAASSLRLRYLALALLPILGVALLASGSRGPVLGLLVGLTCYALLLRDRSSRRRLLSLWFTVIAIVMLAPQLIPGQSIQRSLSFVLGSEGGLSSNGRFELWKDAWQTFASHPVFGIGTGGFGAVRPDELYPHNLFLEVGAELGIVGLLFVVGILVWGLKSLRQSWRFAPFEERPALALVVALTVSALVNALLSSDIQNNSALWLALGLGIGLELRAGDSSSERRSDPARPDALVRPPNGRFLPTAEYRG
jgi:O-antigen ligase